jgi:tRNA/tmRNA/rRNA uracil-C5-methylase (TrmA/RlmC/RlmD family)
MTLMQTQSIVIGLLLVYFLQGCSAFVMSSLLTRTGKYGMVILGNRYFRNSGRQYPKLSSAFQLTSHSVSSLQYHTKKEKQNNSFPFPYHTEVEIEIEDLTNLGCGVGRFTLEDGRQWVIMVPTVLPGERAIVRIFRNHDSYSEADLVQVLRRSVDRVKPQCLHFQSCGGCQYQHMNITAQRHWKKNQIISLLQRIAGIDSGNVTVNPVIGTDHLFNYRSKISPHHQALRPGKPMKIGFQMRSSDVIIDIKQCPIASISINEKYAEFRCQQEKDLENFEAPTESKDTKRKRARGKTLLFREADNNYVTMDTRELITETVNGVQFQFKAGEFFQNNKYVVPLMVDHVLRHAAADDKSSKCRFLVDAYCGSGLFSLCGAQYFDSVYGVEVSQLAVTAAKQNAKSNSITNVEFLAGSSEAIFDQIQHLPPDETVVIIDPPRKGCDSVFLNQLFSFKPRKVVYVSCDPSTQARDAKFFLENNYEIVDVTPFDLFPQTRHIENIIVFRQKNFTVTN